jgi:pre-mRNA-processing factor 17
MASMDEYPTNLRPITSENALIVRDNEAQHAVVPYTAESLARQELGPANPFAKEEDRTSSKRKNVLTGRAEETFLSEHTFRSKSLAIERRGGPERAFISGAEIKEEAARIRQGREGKGSALVADGDGAYVGPWAKYQRKDHEDLQIDEAELGSDEEYEVIEEEEEEVVESGTVIKAPTQALERRKEVEEMGEETTTFHGAQEHDYLGRTYMHVPQDLDIRLDKDLGIVQNFIPKKHLKTLRGHTKAVTALQTFPHSGHILLSGSADNTVKIWDCFHSHELLRTISGHTKAVTDVNFNADGTRFLSASFDRMIKLWDTETGKCISRFTTGKTPHTVRFNPFGEFENEMIAGMSDGKIIQWDIRDPATIAQTYDHHLKSIESLVYIDEGRRIMSTSSDNTIRVWESGINVPIKLIAEVDMFTLTAAALHPRKKEVAMQSSDNQVLIYQTSDKYRMNRKKSYRGHNTAGRKVGLAYSPDGQFLASGDTAGFAVFWDVKTAKMYHKIKASDEAVTCVEWSPQTSSQLFTAGLAPEIKLWD